MPNRPNRAFARGVLALALPVAGLGAGVVTADSAAADTGTFSNPAVIAIPSSGVATPYPSAIGVSGLSGVITDVNVTLTGFAHLLPHDVGVVLVAPNNDALLLMDGAGNAALPGSFNLTFDDSAATQLPIAGGIAGGTYRPTAYYTGDSFNAPGPGTSYGQPGPAGFDSATLASMFNGDPANGSWKLYIKDFTPNNDGSVNGGWSLAITTSQNTLTVATAGTGAGTVTGTGISCPTDCTEGYPSPTAVTLTATPAADSTFAGWSGACSGTGPCSVSMTLARSVTAAFTKIADTTILKGPKAKATRTKAKFAFASSLAGASFECSLDGKAFAPCTSPATYKQLKKGKHKFSVRAISAGTADRTPATYKWKVKPKPR